MANKLIHLPCLRGNFGDWSYFSTVIRVKDIVEFKRIITVAESQSLYTQNINRILQRDIDEKRIDKIKNYLLKSKERFFGSLIVAIHKGNPEWADFDLERRFKVDNHIVDDDEIEFIENKIGILTLTGAEEIFVLDGQHRLLGLRAAYKADNNMGNDEQSLVFVIHKHKLIERTRRLFTVLNRYAVSIKPLEKVILEEDDAAAILTRRLVSEHKVFLKENALSTSKSLNLAPSDYTNFTTLVCLYEINKVLIEYKNIHKSNVIIRPSDEILNTLYKDIKSYWNFFFDTFPKVVKYIDGERTGSDFVRNKQNGGSLLLRPEGQLLIASVYKRFEKERKGNVFKQNIAKIDFNLSSKNWLYVFWRGDAMETKYKKLKRSILEFILGVKQNEPFIKKELGKIYKEHRLKYTNQIKPIVRR